MRRFGLVTAAGIAVLAATFLAPTAIAAPLVVEDPAGDALDARPEMDIVSVTFESKRRNPRNTPSLVVTIELAGPIDKSTATAVSYNVDTEVPGCGYLNFTWSPGTLLEGGPGTGAYSKLTTNCGGEPDSTGDGTYRGIDAKAELDGNKLILWSSLESLTEEVRDVGEITNIEATTENAEPATGIIATGIVGVGTDEATSDAIWRF